MKEWASSGGKNFLALVMQTPSSFKFLVAYEGKNFKQLMKQNNTRVKKYIWSVKQIFEAGNGTLERADGTISINSFT